MAEHDAVPRMTEPTGRVIARCVAVLTIFASVAVLYVARALLIPIVAAILLALLFKPVVRFFWSRRVRPVFTASIIVVGLTALVLGLLYLVVDPISTWIEEAPKHTEQLEQKLESFKMPFRKFTEVTERLDEAANVAGEKGYVQPVELRSGGLASAVFSQTTGVLIGIVTTLMLTFFLLAASDEFLNALVELIPRFPDKKAAVEAFRELERDVSAYLVVRTAINIVLGIATAGVMWALEVPQPVFWGILAAIFNYIPYLGPAIVTAFIAISSIIAFDSLGEAAMPPFAFLTLNFIEGMILCPVIFGKRLRLNPVVVFISLMFWGWLWGIAGAFMAVPLTVCIRIALDRIAPLRPYGRFLVSRGDRPTTERPAPTPDTQPTVNVPPTITSG